ncbi:MAG: heme ABC exporter ATP-binding protein CcmA, partial [Gemmatimonadetes bacterium]|nr:heme ABC exporter ATP-binding protein CcmA [Gemmatimonadota bacterium]
SVVQNTAPRLAPELALDARGVARRFGARWVLRGVNLQVRAGEIVGLLGHNGCGKSTLLRIVATLLKSSAGDAYVYGANVRTEGDDVRRHVGFFAHVPGLYDDLTARENLAFAATMLGLPSADIDAAIERVGLAHVTHERVRGFSAGMQRRLSLARLILQRPRLLLLDEPYNNLDIAGMALVNDFIRDLSAAGGAALIVVHDLAPAAGVLERTVTIRDGRVAVPTAADLTHDGASPEAVTLPAGAAGIS